MRCLRLYCFGESVRFVGAEFKAVTDFFVPRDADRFPSEEDTFESNHCAGISFELALGAVRNNTAPKVVSHPHSDVFFFSPSMFRTAYIIAFFFLSIVLDRKTSSSPHIVHNHKSRPQQRQRQRQRQHRRTFAACIGRTLSSTPPSCLLSAHTTYLQHYPLVLGFFPIPAKFA